MPGRGYTQWCHVSHCGIVVTGVGANALMRNVAPFLKRGTLLAPIYGTLLVGDQSVHQYAEVVLDRLAADRRIACDASMWSAP